MKTAIYILFIVFVFSIKILEREPISSESNGLIELKDEKIKSFDREIVSDSIQYELRLWVGHFFIPRELIQITKDFDNNWNYRFGYYKYTDSSRIFVFIDTLRKKINWEVFSLAIDSFKLSEMVNQREIDLITFKNGKKCRARNEDFFSNISDGVVYEIEIFDNISHKTIYYNNPESYLTQLERIGFSTKEHKEFIRLVNYLKDTFDLKQLTLYHVRDYIKNK